jgi:glycerol kinase
VSRKTPLFLAIDQGGHASRALVFDARGRLKAAAQTRIATRHVGRNKVEHDPGALLASIDRACKGIERQLGPRYTHIQAAGLATQRSTIVCWDKLTGRALTPVISWQDRRAAHRLADFVPYQSRLHDITGLVLSPHYGASKIAWCLEKLKPVQRALQKRQLAAGPLASFILTNLLIERPQLVDPVNASRTLLWDYTRRVWSNELLTLFRIPASILPHCVPNQFAFGRIPFGGRDIPLTVVTGDQSAAMYASGEPDPENIYINFGTGAFIQRLHGEIPPQTHGMLGSVLWQDQSRALYVIEGTVNGAGSALDWLCERLDIGQKEMLSELPKWLDATSEVPLFLNGISGLGSPYWVSNFRSRFIGSGNAMQKMVAVTESIVFLSCVNLDRMRNLNKPSRLIIVSGGLAQWDGLCQRLANLSELPVHRPAQHEATASGIAWLLGARSRRPAKLRTFMPRTDVQFKQRYANWLAAMDSALARSKICRN